jgi:uncharacterized phage protein gp47/JayE
VSVLNLPSLTDIINRIRADVRSLLSTLDPTIFGSFIRGITDSNAGRHYDNVQLIAQLEKELFPQTAEGEALERWGGYERLSRFPASASSGNATATGVASTLIPALTSFRSADGELYTTVSDATIADLVTSITSLTRSGTTVTAITASAHNLASNLSVTIAGAVESDYNGTFTITVISETSFTYEITGTPSSPATGTITVTCTCVTLDLESNETAANTNLDNGAELTLTSPIAGVDAIAYVQFAGIKGGADEESDEDYLVRVLQSRGNPVANFNPAAIEKEARTIQGVTRVKVKRITPEIGAVTILFVRDDDDNIIPDAAEVAEVRAVLLVILPAQSDEADLVVTAPTPVTTDYNFSSIVPDTVTMRHAIEDNLADFYRNEVDFETDITEDKYRSAIINTIDPETGDSLISFVLSSPTGDIPVTTDSIGVLGSVIFP